ncbi:hypothetical protein [Burkholderia sp. TSV86]|uniref:hypothetical protein n=1 Tax=Burkholderia sp. TSV86 TaxID=1385594 RepID=UPI0012E3D6D6|nr:hypothetical protein [Burkholderia sp. TSV86]
MRSGRDSAFLRQDVVFDAVLADCVRTIFRDLAGLAALWEANSYWYAGAHISASLEAHGILFA